MAALSACSISNKDDELDLQIEQPLNQLYNDALNTRCLEKWN